MSTGQGIGSFMTGLAGGFNVASDLARDAEREKLLKRLEASAASATPAATPGATTPSAPPGPEQFFARNSAWVKPGTDPASFNTSLGDKEADFRKWVTDNKVPFDPNATGPQDYDMRGFYKALQAGDPVAKSSVNSNDGKLHYPDVWKTPYHRTFSNGSQWATPDAPSWNDKDQLIDKSGNVIFDERAGRAVPSTGRSTSSRTSDPVATDLAPHQRAFLNAISDGESAGKYNVRYTPKGGAEFSDLSRHPGIMEPGPEGPSSAAGRYQFTKSTWDAMGGGNFSPENQDRRAWQLAVNDYNKRTGRNLDEDLQKNGLTSNILRVLTPTWTSFGNNTDKHIGAYNDSLSRYSSVTPKSIASATTPSKSSTAIGIMSEIMPKPKTIIQ